MTIKELKIELNRLKDQLKMDEGKRNIYQNFMDESISNINLVEQELENKRNHTPQLGDIYLVNGIFGTNTYKMMVCTIGCGSYGVTCVQGIVTGTYLLKGPYNSLDNLGKDLKENGAEYIGRFSNLFTEKNK